MSVLPSPVFISAILPSWRTVAPMSWTSKRRMPSVRFMASRVIAKTSGRTSSSAFWRRAFSRLRRSLVSSRRRSRSSWWSSSSDGSSGCGARADLVADLGELGADLLVGQRLEFGLERVGLVDQGLDASKLAVVRVDETGKESHGTVSIRSDRRNPRSGWTLGASPRSPCRSPRPGSGTSARRGPSQNSTDIIARSGSSPGS